MGSKQPQPLPETLAPYDPNVPGIKPLGPPPPPPPPPYSPGVNPDRPFPPPPTLPVIEEIYVTIAETGNGFVVTTPHSSGERTSMVFEQREGDDCMVQALIDALYDVIGSLGYNGSKHDTCRIKVSCQNEENE